MTNGSWEAQPLETLKVPMTSRIALILSHKRVMSKLLVTLMFIIYQIEILTIVLKPTAYSIRTGSEPPSQIFINVYNTVYFEDLETIRSSENILSILAIMGIYLLVDISLVIYMVVALHKRKQVQQTIGKICNTLASIHQLLLFCPIHIFCCKVLYMLYKGEESTFQTESLVIGAKVLSWLIIVINSVWCFAKLLLFTINIETKDPLASKTNLITLLDFAFRVILPILETFALLDETFIYALLVANLVYSLLRDCLLFYFLPYFRLLVLKVAVISHAVITSFAFADLMSRPISQSRSYTELKFLFPIWVLCLIVIGKLYTRYFNMLIRKILQKPTNVSNPYHLIHYFRIYRFYSKASKPRTHTDRVKENYFIYTSITKQLAASQHLFEGENLQLDHKTQAIVDQHFIKYTIDLLKTAIKKNPKISILRIKLAHYYSKYENLYVLANQTLDDSIQFSSRNIKNSYFFIKVFILTQLKNLIKDQNDNGSTVDRQMLQKYIYVQERYKQLKRDINAQLKIGIQFWKEFQSPGSDYLSLTNLGDQASNRATRIKRRVLMDYKAFLEVNFVEPLLTYSLFFFLGENDVISAQKWFTEYSQFKFKTVRSAKTTNVNPESLYFIISASQDQFGTIRDYSGQVENIFRIRKEVLIKQQLSIIMPQAYGKWFEDLLRGLYTSSNLEILNKTIEIPILMKDGYIMSHSLTTTLNYISEFGLCFFVLLSPLSKSNSNRTAIIMENGQILNISKEFSEDMGIDMKQVRDRKMMSIYHLCPSLEGIIKNLGNKTAGDMPRSPENQSKMHISFTEDEEAAEKSRSPHNYGNGDLKKVDLVFSSFYNKELQYETSPTAKKFVEYTTEIRMRQIQGGHFFELILTRINDKRDQMLTKSSRTPTNYMSNPLRTVLTDNSQSRSPRSPSKICRPSQTQKRESSPKAKMTGEQLVSQNNLLHLETVSENATNQMTLMSPLSEERKLMSFPKGDADDNIDFNSQESPKEFNLLSFDKEKEKHDETQPALDFLSVSDAESSAFSTSVKQIDAYRQIRRAIESRTYQRSKYVYILWFIVTLIVQMTFLIWLNIYTSSVSKNVGILSQVIQSSYFRSYWMKIATQDIMMIAVLRADWFHYDYDLMIGGLTQDLESTNQYNQDLMMYLSLLDDEIQSQFYQKDVRIKERDENDTLQLVSMDDTFEATDKMISYGFQSMNETQRFFTGPDILDSDTKFVVDNSFNDLMIVSANLTSFVETKLFSTFTDAKSAMKGALYTGVTVLVLFILVSIKFVSSLHQDSGRFLDIISSFELDEIAKTENHLSIFMELLENDATDTEMLGSFSRATSKLQRKPTHMKNTNRDANKRNKISHRASMKKFKTRNYLMLIGLFICLGLMAGFMVIYYSLASDKVLTMERQHTSLNSALNFLNIVSYTVAEMEIVSILNGTSTIENTPVLDFLAETANQLNNISELQDTLKDSNGNTPAYQQAILFKFNCTEVYSPYYSFSLEDLEGECFPIANGLDTIGLLEVIIQLRLNINQFIWEFENEVRDIPALQAKCSDAYAISAYTDMGIVLLLLSYTYSVETFANLIVELENERVTLAWIAVVVSIFLGVITWIFIVRKLVRKEFQQKRMLTLIPARLAIGNYLLMKYVTELK